MDFCCDRIFNIALFKSRHNTSFAPLATSLNIPATFCYLPSHTHKLLHSYCAIVIEIPNVVMESIHETSFYILTICELADFNAAMKNHENCTQLYSNLYLCMQIFVLQYFLFFLKIALFFCRVTFWFGAAFCKIANFFIFQQNKLWEMHSKEESLE